MASGYSRVRVRAAYSRGGGLGLQLCNSSIAPVTQLVAQGANNTKVILEQGASNTKVKEFTTQ